MTPGYKTSEFWLALIAQILAGGAASGQLPTAAGDNPGWVQLIGLVASAVIPLGYAWLRAQVKKAETQVQNQITHPVPSTTTPGGLVAPEVSAETVALTAALKAVLDRFDAEAAKIKPQG